jgi:hypothetical protein
MRVDVGELVTNDTLVVARGVRRERVGPQAKRALDGNALVEAWNLQQA